jgi:hypothetical protein
MRSWRSTTRSSPKTRARRRRIAGALVERLVDHINSGLEIDVLIELWRLIQPRHSNLWYDEVEERIHYNEEAEAAPLE